MADRKISDLTALTAPASGDYLPIVDISEAAAANKNKRITIEELFRGVPLGTAAAPSIAIEGDENTGIYSPGADQLAISTGGSGRLFVDATGGVQIDKTGAGGAKITSTVQSTVYFSNAANTGGYIIGRSIGSDNAHNLFSYDATNSHYVDYFEGGSGGYRSFYTNGTERLRITSTGQLSHIGAGAPGTPAVSFSGSAPVNSLVVDSSGRCGIGTSSPGYNLDLQTASTSLTHNLKVNASAAAGNYAEIAFQLWQGAGSGPNTFEGSGTSRPGVVIRAIDETGAASGDLVIGTFTGGATNATLTEKLRLTSSGRLGIGTTGPLDSVSVASANYRGLTLETSTLANRPTITFRNTAGSGNSAYIQGNNYEIAFGRVNQDYGGHTESARFDGSGRLLVGTSTALTNIYEQATSYTPNVQFASASQSYNAGLSLINYSGLGYPATLTLGQSGSNTLNTNALVGNGNCVGSINFVVNDGTNFRSGATVQAFVDASSGSSDVPTRLVFSTTADGASSPTERMRISNNGDVWIANTTGSASNTGFIVTADGATYSTRSGDRPAYINRLVNDGDLVAFVQDNTIEGTISVSGTTVSYNGAHLSRWSQLPSGAERTEILRGTVLSNIDEMCEWGDEENEQLNRMKVSDVEGDKNVSGVFQAWDDDDDTYTNDFYCAMTGDFIIRIAQGVTVERGDLLISAGDGTAKPQDDDIIRSKTIAKVTSTNVTCTYPDGSYCVPCVLMAC